LTSLCEQFSPDNEWFVKMMNKIFIVGGDLVTERVAFNMLILIAEGILTSVLRISYPL
jgi:hypothetical protein